MRKAAEIQHQAAKQLLPHIAEAWRDARRMGYRDAAILLGRDPAKNRRMAAQVCDLLDAAAQLANVPLLALLVVREQSGSINHKAFAGDPKRDEILTRSLDHAFTENDFNAIALALTKLSGMGNRRAWKVVNDMPSASEDVVSSLTARASLDAINDLEGDGVAQRRKGVGFHFQRDQKVRDTVLQRSHGKCEYCGEKGFQTVGGGSYLETHHIIALAKDGKDLRSNVIALCANHHRQAHYGVRRKVLEGEMTKIVHAKETDLSRRTGLGMKQSAPS